MTRRCTITTLGALLALAAPLGAQTSAPAAARAPSEIVSAAPQADWVRIAATDLLVMTLAPDARGRARRVVIQLIPAPFSQGWVRNIRKLAAAHWWDATSINRVQDNYVVQWGDVTEKKPLPTGLEAIPEQCYVVVYGDQPCPFEKSKLGEQPKAIPAQGASPGDANPPLLRPVKRPMSWQENGDAYRTVPEFFEGWPVAFGFGPDARPERWPVHCYAMVGVGRNLSPDTGSGAELYTVIGHAPRHLDRNIALVGRVIEGMEHLSSLPRGAGALGFYPAAEAKLRTPILSVRLASELPAPRQPKFEYLSTESESFASYAEARANRRDAFFIRPAGGADICNLPVPVRRVRP